MNKLTVSTFVLLIAIFFIFSPFIIHAANDNIADFIILDNDDGGPDDENEQVYETLKAGFENGTTEQRQSIIWSSRIQTKSLRVLKLLQDIALNGSPELAVTATVTLGEIRRSEAVSTLIKILDSKSKIVQESAAYSLGLIGDLTVAPSLTAHLPNEEGLSRWIYLEALDRIAGRPVTETPRCKSLHDASVYFIGGTAEEELRNNWKDFIFKYNLRIKTAPPGDINPQMGHYGGAPNTVEFFDMLKDKNGKPQIDIVVLCGVLPFEFSIDLQWYLYQYVRRGGILITLGNSMFYTGKLSKPNGELYRKFAPANSFWISSLPESMDNKFKTYIAGFKGIFRNTLRTGIKDFGKGKVISLVYGSPASFKTTQLFGMPTEDSWQFGKGYWKFPTSNYEIIFNYAIEGDIAFPVILDLANGPETVKGTGPAVFSAQLISAARENGILKCELLTGNTVIIEQAIPIDMEDTTVKSIKPSFTLPVSIPDGKYTARLTYTTKSGSSSDVWPFDIASPIKINWNFKNQYRDFGLILTGNATIISELIEPLKNIELSLNVTDRDGRILQRLTKNIDILPGTNPPVELSLPTRDLLIGVYGLNISLHQNKRVLQSNSRLLFRDGSYDYKQDLVYAPWGQFNADNQQMVQAYKDAGLNSGTMYATPGWYSWGVCGPNYNALPTWPGNWVAKTSGYYPFNDNSQEFAKDIHERLTSATTIHMWDESEINIISSQKEDIAPVSSVLYRNWIKSRYFSIDSLNSKWSKEYKKYPCPSKKIPAPQDWNGDYTSWNQIWTYRGSNSDWNRFNDLWSDLAYQCRNEFRKIDKGDHPWLWFDLFHTRVYPSTRPNETNYQAHEGRGTLGDVPSSIMLHYIFHIPTLPGIARMLNFDALAGGGRHFIIYRADDNPDSRDPAPIWKPGFELKPHGKELAESIHAIRAKEQVFLDSRNKMSKEVAFLYHGTASWPPGSGTPKPLFDALVFGGIHPESLKTGSLRSERMSLSSFKVIFRCGNGNLPANWQKRIDDWQKNGGIYLNSTEYPFTYRGGGSKIKIDEFTFTSGTSERIGSPGFTEYQTKIFDLLKKNGVLPPFQVVDDNGLPELALYPVLMHTEDNTQEYITAISDWDHWTSQAFDKTIDISEKIDITKGWNDGAKFNSRNTVERYRLWVEVKLTGSFSAKVTIDGEGGTPFPMENDPANNHLWAERGTGQTRWIAGPEFILKQGEHILVISNQNGGSVTRAILTNKLNISPTLKVASTNVKQVYDVYHDRILTKKIDGWTLPMGLSECTVLSLITEELGDIKLEPRLLKSDTDQMLQLKVQIGLRDDTLSKCRHAINILLKDAKGMEIPTLRTKASINGWGVVMLFPGVNAPDLPWTIEVKDLTSGKMANALITAESKNEFTSLSPIPSFDFYTEPLLPMEGDIHIMPFKVTIRNNVATTLQGKIKIELPENSLIDSKPEIPITLSANTAATLSWTAIIGRNQAINLQDSPPRVWLTLKDGTSREIQFNDIWIRRWESTPPLVTNLQQTNIPLSIYNFTDKLITAKLQMNLAETWSISRDANGEIIIPAMTKNAPGLVTSVYTAILKPYAQQLPEVKRLPLQITFGNTIYDAGVKLVETEKHRRWQMVSGEQVLDENNDTYEPVMPTEAVNAIKENLWDVKWTAVESDTLINFTNGTSLSYYAITNVSFPKAGDAAIRIRGDAKVQVWLGGVEIDPYEKKKKIDEIITTYRDRVPVLANNPIPLVILYKSPSNIPLSNDLVFLDKDDNIIWEADYDIKK